MLCAVCKGKRLCGLDRCPIVARFSAGVNAGPVSEYSGKAPSVFVGSSGYPAVRGGPLLTADPDNPPAWIDQQLGIGDIVALRARTIRGLSPLSVHLDPVREIALSSRPVDVEVGFERPVRFNLDFDGIMAPVGMSGPLSRIEVTGNPVVERVVDRVVSDTDLPAGEACTVLHSSGIEVYRIIPLMTAGLLGRKRTVVPTRWAITAVDDTLSIAQKHEIAGNPPIGGIRIYSSELFANRIAVILIPGDWRFEMIERWGEGSLWSGGAETIVSDREGLRKSGYSPITGAYYSARLAVTGFLEKTGRSARAIVIRNVGSGYWAPLGTWVVREAARAAMAGEPREAATLDEAVEVAATFTRFPHWARHSTLLRMIRTQRTLAEFLS